MASMSYQQPDSTSSTSFNTSTVQGPPQGNPRRRSDTSSSTSSATVPVPIPPGFYTLPTIHGSCPKCHHYHKAASINVRVSLDPNRVSYVCCEKCKEKWFAFGASNSTRISLLSTQTTEPDIVERSFRYALMDMVRSVTSVASASALASVPEQPSRVPSRRQSLHSGVKDDQGDHPESHYATLSTPDLAVSGLSLRPASQEAQPHDTDRLRHLEPNRSLIEQISASIKKRLLPFRTSRLRKFLLPKNETRSSAKAQGKLPVVAARVGNETITGRIPEATISKVEHDANVSSVSVSSAGARKPNTAPEIVTKWGDVEKTKVKSMSMKKRVTWFRKQYTEFKVQHALDHCRRPRSTTTNVLSTEDLESHLPPPSPSPQSPPQRPMRRSYSEDLLLIGSHLQVFQPGEFLHHRISVGSSTRLSQTGTAVNSDSLTATSGVPYLDISLNQGGQLLRTPRPASLSSGASHLHPSMGLHDTHNRLSVDSLSANGPGRGPSDRRSMASIPSLSLTGETAHSLGPPPTNSYTTSYRTSGEHSQDLRST